MPVEVSFVIVKAAVPEVKPADQPAARDEVGIIVAVGLLLRSL